MNEEELEIKLEEEEIFDISIDDEDTLNASLENDIVEIIEKNYKKLDNKPSINNVELIENKTLEDLNIQKKGDYASETLTNLEIEEIINKFI